MKNGKAKEEKGKWKKEDEKWKTFSVWASGMILAFVFGWLAPFMKCNDVQSQIYAPSDSIPLTVGTTDTTLLTVADAESVWFKWFRPAGTIIDSSKITSSTRTGFYIKKVKASDGSNTIGAYSWEAIAYKNGKTGIKTGSWVVKSTTPESVLTYLATNLDVKTSAVRDTAHNANVSAIQARDTSALIHAEVVNINGWNPATDSTNVKGLNSIKLGYLDKAISGIDDNPWNNVSSDTGSGMGKWFADWWHDINDDSGQGGAGSCPTANQNASAVWSYSGNITLIDTIPKVYAVNAAGSDPDTLANKVWTWPSRTLTSGAGSGAHQVKIIAKQSSDSAEIVSATVQVLNGTQTSTIGLLSTGSNGDAIFALDTDTFKIRMYKPGWQFTVPQIAIVSKDTTITYYADLFNPGNPPSASLCRVYGWIKDINNLPIAGAKIETKVKIVPLRFGSVIISPYYKVATTDSDGYWYLDLYPNSDLTPTDTKYQFFMYSPSGTILKLETIVPDQASWELSF